MKRSSVITRRLMQRRTELETRKRRTLGIEGERSLSNRKAVATERRGSGNPFSFASLLDSLIGGR